MSSERKPLNDVEEPSSTTQSADCSDSANCMTASAADSESLESVVSTGTMEVPLESVNLISNLCSGDADMVVTGTFSHSGTAAQLIPSHHREKATASDRELVAAATSSRVDSSVSPHTEGISTTGQKTDGCSATELSQHSRLLAEVTCDTEHCQRDSSICVQSRKHSTQSTIQSFFKPVSKGQQGKTGMHSMKNSGQSALSHSRDATLHRNTEVQNSSDKSVDNSHSLKTGANKAVFTESSGFTDKTRKCPFYKWIPGKVS